QKPSLSFGILRRNQPLPASLLKRCKRLRQPPDRCGLLISRYSRSENLRLDPRRFSRASTRHGFRLGGLPRLLLLLLELSEERRAGLSGLLECTIDVFDFCSVALGFLREATVNGFAALCIGFRRATNRIVSSCLHLRTKARSIGGGFGCARLELLKLLDCHRPALVQLIRELAEPIHL